MGWQTSKLVSNAMQVPFCEARKLKYFPFQPPCLPWDPSVFKEMEQRGKLFLKDLTAGKLFWARFRLLLFSLLSAWKLMGCWMCSSNFVTIREKFHDIDREVERQKMPECFMTLWLCCFSPRLPASEFIVT